MFAYRKKPVVIEAFQWSIDAEAPEWWEDAIRKSTAWVEDSNHAYIGTLEGVVRVRREDYVIKGVQGELYPCKPDIFTATYDKV